MDPRLIDRSQYRSIELGARSPDRLDPDADGSGQAFLPVAVLDHLQAELRHLAAHRFRCGADDDVDTLAPGGQRSLGGSAHQGDPVDPEQLLGRTHPARPARCEDDCRDASHAPSSS